MGNFVWFLDYSSVFIFALTGALVASRAQLDPVGFIFMATMTAVGGGTLRDLFLDRHPIFWVESPELILIAGAAAILVFFTAHLFENRYRALLWFDAVALSVAVPAGVGAAMAIDMGVILTVLAGVVTGTFGGLMRDVVANQVPLVLKKGELYLTAACGGAVLAVFLTTFGISRPEALICCGGLTFVLRAGSLRWGWRLPVYKSLPPRH